MDGKEFKDLVGLPQVAHIKVFLPHIAGACILSGILWPISDHGFQRTQVSRKLKEQGGIKEVKIGKLQCIITKRVTVQCSQARSHIPPGLNPAPARQASHWIEDP